MFYYKFTAETPYCGTECEEYVSFDVQPSKAMLDEMAEELRQVNADGYEYLVSGWNDENFEGMTEEEREEEIANYYADCWGGWEEITKEEFEENS